MADDMDITDDAAAIAAPTIKGGLNPEVRK